MNVKACADEVSFLRLTPRYHQQKMKENISEELSQFVLKVIISLQTIK